MRRSIVDFSLVLGLAVAAGGLITEISTTEAMWLVLLWVAWSLSVVWSLTRPVFSIPFAAINGSMLVFVIIPATIHVASGRTSIAGYDFTAGTDIALKISAFAQIAFFAGALLARTIRPGPRLNAVHLDLSRSRLESAALVGLGAGLAGLALEVASGHASLSQFFVFTTQKGYGSFYTSATGTISGYFLALQLVAGIAVVLVVLRFTSTRVRSGYWLPLIVLAASTLLLLGNGQRVRFLVPLLASGLVWFKTTRRSIGARRVTLAALIILVAFSAVIGIARGVSGSRSITLTSVTNEAFGRDELFAPLAGLTTVLPSEVRYLGGSSYLETLVFPIPRALWHGKPTGKISAVIHVFDPGGAGLAFPEFGEMYANFGFAGVVVGSILFGLLVEWLWIRLAESRSVRETVFLSVSFSILAELFVRGAAAPMLVTFLGFLLVTLLLCRRSSSILDPISILAPTGSSDGRPASPLSGTRDASAAAAIISD